MSLREKLEPTFLLFVEGKGLLLRSLRSNTKKQFLPEKPAVFECARRFRRDTHKKETV